jgi:hypothetical protein
MKKRRDKRGELTPTPCSSLLSPFLRSHFSFLVSRLP